MDKQYYEKKISTCLRIASNWEEHARLKIELHPGQPYWVESAARSRKLAQGERKRAALYTARMLKEFGE